jgi:hypothetical protein
MFRAILVSKKLSPQILVFETFLKIIGRGKNIFYQQFAFIRS